MEARASVRPKARGRAYRFARAASISSKAGRSRAEHDALVSGGRRVPRIYVQAEAAEGDAPQWRSSPQLMKARRRWPAATRGSRALSATQRPGSGGQRPYQVGGSRWASGQRYSLTVKLLPAVIGRMKARRIYEGRLAGAVLPRRPWTRPAERRRDLRIAPQALDERESETGHATLLLTRLPTEISCG